MLAASVFLVLYLKIVPGGETVYEYEPDKENGFIGEITPDQRVERVDQGVKIREEPVYFTFRTPRRFERAEVEVEFDIIGEDIHLLEMGVLADEKNKRYRLKPVWHGVIDDLSSVWNVVEEEGEILAQREEVYQSIEEFSENPPPLERIALYDHPFSREYLLDDYQPSPQQQRMDIPLRGSYEFFTYIKEEPLDFEFELLDINEDKEEDDLYIDLYHRDNLVHSRHIEDDGVATDSEERNALGKKRVRLEDMPEGVYKVEVRAGDDIITESISTPQQKLSFVNKIYLAAPDRAEAEESAFYPASLITNSPYISAKTVYPDSLQTIKAGDENQEELELKKTYEKFSREIPKDPKKGWGKLELEKGGVILAGDGVFSFSASSFLDPRLKELKGSDQVNEEVDFILARYTPPEQTRRGWKQEAAFELDAAYAETEEALLPPASRRYEFVISAPGLKDKKGAEEYVKITDIRVQVKGRSLWSKVKELLFSII